jgi:oligoendopeptidase F
MPRLATAKVMIKKNNIAKKPLKPIKHAVPKTAPVAKTAPKSSPAPTLKPTAKIAKAATGAPKAATRAPKAARPVLAIAREKVRPADTWDLSPLFKSDALWETEYTQASDRLPRFELFKGRLAESAKALREFLAFDAEFSRLLDRLGNFAHLRTSEDQGNSVAQRLRGKFQHLATKYSEATSWFRPELMALPAATVDAYLASPELTAWKLAIENIVRYRPHTLSDAGEHLLAMQGQMAEASNQIFRQLNDADLKFGNVTDEGGRAVELTHASFSSFLNSSDRDVRRTAFHQFYAQYEAHKNTLAAALSSSVHRDVYYAKARHFRSAREASLFPDNVPTAVYDNLIASVRKNLPAVHRYLDIRKRAMKLRTIHHYDTYVPILSDLKKHHTWEQAVKVVCGSLAPLGTEYVETLRKGLTTSRWADRYPNAGKQSGAFSSGCFDSPPYILMNFQEDVLEHVFTLTHEAGHSMHSWYSARNQPYQYHDYVIFVAEVASTFNEQLLARHLMANATDPRERAYLINRQIDAIRSTIVRQTMFAEYERDIHAQAENGEPLTVQSLRATYRKLLEAYFGNGFTIDPELELEGMRIPHFYRAFYVYKYATGLSAAIALTERVTSNTPGALDAYLTFLKSGGSKFPLDLLRTAGVDMATPAPVDAALKRFAELVNELDELV